MWQLDHKEGWVTKNWWFWTVVLKKTLETPLDSKEIKPVNPKGSQPCIFPGRTNAETPILWPPDANGQLTGKDPGVEKDWGQKKEVTEDEMVGWLNGHEFEQTWGDSEAQGSLVCLSPWGHKEWPRVVNTTEQQWGLRGEVTVLWATSMTAKVETARASNDALQVLSVDNKDERRKKEKNKHLPAYSDQEGGCRCCSAIQSCPTLRHHGLQHTRPLCPPPSPEVCPSSCPLHLWCCPAISSSDSLFSFCLQSFPASGTFPRCQLLTPEDRNTGASALVLPVNIQGWSHLRLTDLISTQSKGLSGVFPSTTVWRHQFFGILLSLGSSSHNCTWTLGRP